MMDHWKGWRALPAARANGWVDLSHRLHAGLFRIPFFPEPRFGRVMSMPADRLNLTEIQMVCHFGTHVDAPCHFFAVGPAMLEIPFERLHGPGVVWRVAAEPFGVIEAEMLARMTPALRPGDIVLLDTGWSAHVGTARYAENPSLSVGAAQWLVDQGAKLLGIDFLTPDVAVSRRPEGFDWPVHHVLLGQGVLIAENLTNLRSLAGRRVDVIFAALSIEGADGAPARVIARAVSS
jgi:kynurenine formamidase